MRNRFVILVTALVTAILLGFALTGCEFGSDEDATAIETVKSVPVPNGPDPIIDSDQQQTSSDRPAGVDEHEDAKDETPPGVTPAEVEKIEEARPEGLGKPKPLGGAQLVSCVSHPVQNWSARATGSRVSMPVVHYTVGGTLTSIQNLFNTPSFGASSHDLITPGGTCWHLVDYSKKAWTQGAFNSVSDSIEIVCCTSDPSRSWWLNQPIVSKGILAGWIVDRLRARGLPPKLVDPVECTPLTGYTDHRRLECGNTHTDVGANFPWDKVGEQVRTIYNGGGLKVWQVRAGTTGLAQRAKYVAAVAWLKNHPTKVREAEKKFGRVFLRRVVVAP